MMMIVTMWLDRL